MIINLVKNALQTAYCKNICVPKDKLEYCSTLFDRMENKDYETTEVYIP